MKGNGIENVETWIGRAAPLQYSDDLSINVLNAGIKLLEDELSSHWGLASARLRKSLLGVEQALSGKEAAKVFEQLPDREGVIFVVSKKNAVVGSREGEHDLSNLSGHRFRSHGGLSEQDIPLLMSRLAGSNYPEGRNSWRNFDVFDRVLKEV
ncbi:hypothetical protein BDZ45DRAFT_755033 [Acephala macrosclerotiorum]|nr:hypothetical protein BDZ45DRAFT_755033 [Acephala macrosclerotiorum]